MRAKPTATAVILAVIVAALTACGSSHPAAAARPSSCPAGETYTAGANGQGCYAAPPPSPPAPTITCLDIDAALTKVLHDLKVENRQQQEAWVSGGKSRDLQNLITDTAPAANGANQLGTDAATFNSDAQDYLSQNSPYLAPGWESGYSTVTSDIDALAADCGLHTVK
jgi:hypothetical protein